jgi:hypothetical protein
MVANMTVEVVVFAIVGMVVTLFQILATCNSLAIGWYKTGAVSDVLTFAEIFGADIDTSVVQCILGFDPVGLYLLKCSVPFLVAVYVLLLHGFSHALARGWDKNKSYNSFGIVYNVFFINFSAIASSPYYLYQHPNDKQSVQAYPTVVVGTGEHISQILMSVVVILFALVPFMALNIYMSKNAASGMLKADIKKQGRQTIFKLVHENILKVRCRFLFYRFKATSYWWGNLLMFRQLLIALAPTLPSNEPHLQVAFTAVVLNVYGAKAAHTKPWNSRVLNHLDVCQCFCLSTFLLASTALLTPPADVEIYTITMMCTLGLTVVACLAGIISAGVDFSSSGEAGLTSRPSEDWNFSCMRKTRNVEETAEIWFHLAETSSRIPSKAFEKMLRKMSVFDYDDIVKCISAWHAVAPEFFPQVSPPKSRLGGFRHSASGSLVIADSEENATMPTMSATNSLDSKEGGRFSSRKSSSRSVKIDVVIAGAKESGPLSIGGFSKDQPDEANQPSERREKKLEVESADEAEQQVEEVFV